VAGVEYLLALSPMDKSGNSVYSSQWAVNDEEEKRAFETFFDATIARWAKYPAMARLSTLRGTSPERSEADGPIRNPRG